VTLWQENEHLYPRKFVLARILYINFKNKLKSDFSEEDFVKLNHNMTAEALSK